jgi:hypothetical protein
VIAIEGRGSQFAQPVRAATRDPRSATRDPRPATREPRPS